MLHVIHFYFYTASNKTLSIRLFCTSYFTCPTHTHTPETAHAADTAQICHGNECATDSLRPDQLPPSVKLDRLLPSVETPRSSPRASLSRNCQAANTADLRNLLYNQQRTSTGRFLVLPFQPWTTTTMCPTENIRKCVPMCAPPNVPRKDQVTRLLCSTSVCVACLCPGHSEE